MLTSKMLGPFDHLPLPAIAILIVVALLAACELGYRVAARTNRSDDSGQGHILSATLGLLALLVGFTFSIALARHDARRNLVLVEANAIGTAYLHTMIAPEPFRGQLAAVLRQYVDARLSLAGAGEDPSAIRRAELLADGLQKRMWAITADALPAIQTPTTAPLLAMAVNAVIDASSERRAALSARVPTSVVSALLLYALVAAGMVGFVTGSGRPRSRVPSAILLVLLSFSLTLILDIDRSRSGMITVSQAPLAELRSSMASP